MRAVNSENFHLFLEGKTEIVQFFEGKHARWKFIGLDPTYAEAYLIAMDLVSHEVKSLPKRTILEQSQDCPTYFIEATQSDIYRKKIEYHEDRIEVLKEWLSKEESK